MPMHTAAEIDAANRYHSYRRGWIDGAARKAMPEEFTKHTDLGIRDAYNLGYQHGYDAHVAALKAAEQRYEHTPTVLRTQPLDRGSR